MCCRTSFSMESGFLASEMALAIPEKIGLRLVIIRNFRMNLVAEVSRTKFDPYMIRNNIRDLREKENDTDEGKF